MGDIEGSSSAAHSAQTDDRDSNSGLFGRIIGAFTATGTDADDGTAEATQAELPAHGMINLRQKTIEDVAIPKADIVSVPVTISKEELVNVFRESGLTRLPVYEGTLDTPIGFAHLKDFALTHGFNGKGKDFDLQGMLRPLLFVPPSMPIGVLLTKMQAERRHMALVIDEYGGVDGLVTIEDLIEQVIGEIEDEHDIGEDQSWVKEKDGCYMALAKTSLTEFEAEIGQSLTDHDEVDAVSTEVVEELLDLILGPFQPVGRHILGGHRK